MATSNFWIENRCIVVQDDDYEAGNHPEIGEIHPSSDRNCGRYYLEAYKGRYNFWDVVISAGYYEHGSIDYVENDNYAEIWNVVGNPDKYKSIDEFVREVQYQLGNGISLYFIRKHFTGIDKKTETIREFVERKWEAFYEAARATEAVKVNAALDELVINWGYTEVRKVGGFSNGSAVYEVVSK